MKLCEKLNRRVGDKEYKKWYVNLTKEQVEDLCWNKDQKLEVKIRGNNLILKPSK